MLTHTDFTVQIWILSAFAIWRLLIFCRRENEKEFHLGISKASIWQSDKRTLINIGDSLLKQRVKETETHFLKMSILWSNLNKCAFILLVIKGHKLLERWNN